MGQSIRVADMHCDTIAMIYERKTEAKPGEGLVTIENYDGHLSLEKMKAGGYGLQNFALYVNLMKHKDPLDYGLKLLDTFYQEMEAHPQDIGIVRTWKEIDENWRAGRMSALLTAEEGGICRGQLCHLRNIYRLGVRMMTLTWNYANELAYPNRIVWEGPERGKCVPETEKGLTETGVAFLEEMERLGMIVDISHLGDAGIWEVFRHTKRPLVASHSNARALAGHPRNLTDDMIRALSQRGGVAGLNFCAAFLRDGGEGSASRLADMVRHVRHMYQTGGIGCIGLGSDFDGIEDELELVDGSGMQLLAQALEKDGFTIGEIEAIFHKNVLRVYREIL